MKTATPTSVTSDSSSLIPAIRILKIASCPSLSGRSTLTYHVGCTTDSTASEIQAVPELYCRVFANSGGGFFSSEWIAMSSIQKAFAMVPTGIALTAHLLSPLFQGKSANTQAFLFAVLKSEGWVSTVKDSKGFYERSDTSGFMSEITALIASEVDLTVEGKPVKVASVKTPKLLRETSWESEPKRSPVASTPAVSGKKAAKKQNHGSSE